jgi:hypothetical protein
MFIQAILTILLVALEIKRNSKKVMVLSQEVLEKEQGFEQTSTNQEHGVSLDETPDDDDDDDSASKASSGTSETNSTRGTKKQETIQEDKILGNALNRQVLGIRLLVVLVLVVSTVTVAVLVFYYIDKQEDTAFEESFVSDANKVLVSLGSKLDLTMGALDSFVVGLASYAKESNSTWPFVTLPDYAVKAKKTKNLSNAVVVSFYPLVTNETRLDWEAYTGPNNYWVNESIAVQEKDSTYHGEVNYSWVEGNVIYNDYGDQPYNRSILMPNWQVYPTIPCKWGCPIYNWDYLGISYLTALEETLDSGKVVFTEAYHLPDENDPASVEATSWSIEWFSDYVEPRQDPSEPISDIYYPVFDNAADQVEVFDSQGKKANEEGNVVAMMVMSIYWRDLIEDVSVFGIYTIYCMNLDWLDICSHPSPLNHRTNLDSTSRIRWSCLGL